MSGTARLLASPEVLAAVSAEEWARLEAKVRAEGYDCAECQQRSPLGAEPAMVVLYDAGPLVGWARVVHARCAPERPGRAGLAGEHLLTVVAGLVPHATGDRAVILAEFADSATATSEAGDRVDLVAGWLMGRGLHPLTRAGQRPPAAPGWSLWLPSPGLAVIAGPETTLYQGTMITPDGWTAVARSRGAELLVGVSGLATLGQEPGTRVIADAARAGRLVGGTITEVTQSLQALPAMDCVSCISCARESLHMGTLPGWRVRRGAGSPRRRCRRCRAR